MATINRGVSLSLKKGDQIQLTDGRLRPSRAPAGALISKNPYQDEHAIIVNKPGRKPTRADTALLNYVPAVAAPLRQGNQRAISIKILYPPILSIPHF